MIKVHIGYGIAFHGLDLWSFANYFARNVIISGADNSSSCHTDNGKNNFLMLGEGPTDDAEKKFGIDFSKAKTKLCLSLHYNGGNSYLFVNRK